MWHIDFASAFISAEDKPKESRNGTFLDENIMVNPENREILDFMHHFPNFTLQVFKYMNNGVGRKAKEGFKQFFLPMVHLFCGDEQTLKLNPDTMYEIPNWVMEYARKRLRELTQSHNHPSWLSVDLCTESFFKAARNYDDILFVLCLFDYVFQDSMMIPFVYCVKQCFDCMSYLYSCVNDLEEASRVQSILDIFLDLLQGITYPQFTNPSIHNSKHYWQSIARAGPMDENDCFYNERSLILAKQKRTSGSNPSITKMKRSIKLEYCSILRHVLQKLGDSLTLPENGSSQDMSTEVINATRNNFCDDMLFFTDDKAPRPTFIDQLCDQTPWSIALPTTGISISKTATLHTSLQFRGSHCHSTTLCGEVSAEDLASEWKSLVFTKMFNGKVRLFLVSGYQVVKINDVNYAQALCHPIETVSCSSFVDTPYKRLLPEKIVIPETVIPISVYRLHFKEVMPLLYPNKRLTVSFLSLKIHQYVPGEHDLLFNRPYYFRNKKTRNAKRV